MSQWTLLFYMINMSPPNGKNRFNKEKSLVIFLVQPHFLSMQINAFVCET